MPLSSDAYECAPLKLRCPSCHALASHRIYRAGEKTLAWCQHCFRVEKIAPPPETAAQ